MELPDYDSTVDDLAGDCYDPKANPDMDPKTLEIEFKRFKQRVEMDGVVGYVLEKWNPIPGCGYQCIDSCFGFIGQYDAGAEDYEHYVVAEMIETAKSGGAK